MDDDVFNAFFAVRKLRGRNEYDIYKSYISELPRQSISFFLNINFHKRILKVKNDVRAIAFRIQGNEVYRLKDFRASLKLYTKSLRHATYNSEAYSLALANRSAAYFSLGDYKACIQDVNLCLNGKYPNILKPKVCIRQAECFKNLGEAHEMQKLLLNTLNLIDNTPELAADTERYKNIINDLMVAEVANKKPENDFEVLPSLEPNPEFFSASSSVTLRYNKIIGPHVIAKKQISRGDVLFVEKAYAFSPFSLEDKTVHKYNCQYCLVKLISSVPCKTCVKHMYCTENCRDAAWREFHKWECLAVQAGLFSLIENPYLALRVVLKAARTGFQTRPGVGQDFSRYGSKDDNYPYVHELCTHFDNMNKEQLMKHAACAAVFVNYLSMKTTFFSWLKEQPAFAYKSNKQLKNKLGGLIIRHCAQLHCNIMHVKSLDEENMHRRDTAIAILPSVAMMSHSCVPNVAYYFVGDTIVVKAVKDIEVNEKVCYAYMDISYSTVPKHIRQIIFAKACAFRCRCQACSDPKMNVEAFDSYLCVKCKGPAVSGDNIFGQNDQFFCLDCNHQFILNSKIITKEKLNIKYLLRFKQLHDISDAVRCLEISKSIFSPFHEIIGAINLELMKYYSEHSANLEKYIEHAKVLVEYAHIKFGYCSYESGIFLHSTCKTLIRMLKENKGILYLERLDKILQDVRAFLDELKMVFDLHEPSFMPCIQKMEELYLELTHHCNNCNKNKIRCQCDLSEVPIESH